MTSGMPDLRRVAAALRKAGAGELRRDMNTGLRAATVFLEADVRAAARAKLPHSGGLAESMASREIGVTVLAGGVRMRTYTLGSMQTDDGFVRHPVFGVWRKGTQNQPIPAATGWWTDTLTLRAPLAAPLIMKQLNITASKIAAVA